MFLLSITAWVYLKYLSLEVLPCNSRTLDLETATEERKRVGHWS
jgi:hypothetical protein